MLPIDRVDAAVLAALAGDVLRPAVVTAIIDGVFQALRPTTVMASVGALMKDARARPEGRKYHRGHVTTHAFNYLTCADGSENQVASLMPASWNQIVTWLRQIDGFRRAA